MTGQFKSSAQRRGFKEEVDPLTDKLYNFALRLTGSQRNAYKLLKEVFVKAIRFYDHLDEVIDFEMWMLRIVRNTFNESYGAKDNDGEEKYIGLPVIEKQDDFDQINKILIDKVPENMVSDSLASLPKELKMAVILRDIMEFTYEEIAGFVDVPDEIVKHRIYSGRKSSFINIYDYAVERGYIKENSKRMVQTGQGENYILSALLADSGLESTINEEIEKNVKLRIEYFTQVLSKSIISGKLKSFPTPEKVKKKLAKKIISESKSRNKLTNKKIVN